MPKTTKSKTASVVTPSQILQKYIGDYQTNPFALSKSLGVAYQTVTFILKEKSKISPQMALRLAKHYGNTPEYWLDIQAQADIAELSADKKFTSQLNKIHKAVKNTGKAKTPKKGTDKTAKPAKKAAKAKSKKKVKAFKTSRKTKK